MGVLENRDTFDWLGQGVTLGSPTSIKFAGQTYLEVLDVDFDGFFNFWRDCNYNRELKRNVCWDSVLSGQWAKRVTRSSAEQLTGNSPFGACDANDIVGSWLSFPLEGKCVGNVTVGDNGCTWKQTGSKVILMDCMKSFNSSGWARAWQEDFQKAPFPNVMAHVKTAVRECPDVRESARRLRGARQN